MSIYRTPCMTDSQGYTLLLGSQERWKDRAVCAAMRSSTQPVYVMEPSRLNSSRSADGLIVGNPLDAASAIAALEEHERATGHRPAAVIPLFEPAIEVGHAISRHFGLGYLSDAAVMNVRSKFHMRRAFEQASLRVPQYVRMFGPQDAEKAAHLRFPVIVKPENLGGGLGVRLVHTAEDLPDALAWSSQAAQALLAYGMHTPSFVVEEYIEAVAEVSVEVLNAPDGSEVVGMTDKILSGPPHFVECAHRFPSRYIQDAAIQDTARLACRAVGMDRGVAHVEIRVCPDGAPVVVEVNGRLPGGAIPELIESCTGRNLFELHCASFVGTPSIEVARKPAIMRGSAAIVFLKAPEGCITQVNTSALPDLPKPVIGLQVWARPGDVSGQGASNFERHGAVELFWPNGTEPWTDDQLIAFAQRLSRDVFCTDG
ncbi:ATP-grasp domain-containing protein [Thalassococcus sp. BH17M4-6]|uniref:ATP-grasp domain-containing protein n=1 Tax=Thalassococcus sp. BH17M4-6 TaxID=3413148 RepID=UPI003BC44BCA